MLQDHAIQPSGLQVRVISRTLLLSLKRQTNGKIDLMVSIPQVLLKHCYFTGSTNQSYIGQTREIRVGVTARCDRPIAASSGALLEREKGYLSPAAYHWQLKYRRGNLAVAIVHRLLHLQAIPRSLISGIYKSH